MAASDDEFVEHACHERQACSRVPLSSRVPLMARANRLVARDFVTCAKKMLRANEISNYFFDVVFVSSASKKASASGQVAK